MNTIAECKAHFDCPHCEQLRLRHLRLLHTLRAAGIHATCGEDDQWMVTMPSMRHCDWLSFAELEPPMDEWIVAIPRESVVGLRVVKRILPQKGGFDMMTDRFEMSRSSDYIFWMSKP